MHVPRATYRVQFTPEFGYKEAKAIVPYLASLGISDLYASPIFKAVPRSLHGYDVTDMNQLNPELGTREDFVLLSLALREQHMGWVQDIVPNHMAFHPDNRMLMDVLEKGDQSEFADFFDMRVYDEGDEKRQPVAVPFLGEPFEQAVNEGKLKLEYRRGRLWVRYFDLAYPLRWESYAEVFGIRNGHPDLEGLLLMLENGEETAAAKEEALNGIWTLYQQEPEARETMDKRLDHVNGQNEYADRFGVMKSVLGTQHYRLASWREGPRQGNYRRFFQLAEFIGLNVERREVFERTHRLISEFVLKGFFQGLRIDHIDGLYQPKQYLERLRERFGEIYFVVEKILSMDERLPTDWPVHGTSGYDFLNFVNGLFCHPKAEGPMTEFYRTFTGQRQDWSSLLRECKLLIMDKFMASDLLYLGRLAVQAMQRNGSDKALSVERLGQAIKELIAELDVYRTYIDEEASADDKRRLEAAIERASGRTGNYRGEMKVIKRLLLETCEGRRNPEARYFLLRFQQLTGPVMAKGLEDTCFYRYNRLVSLNEVGGEPERFGITTRQFDEFIRERAWAFGHSMNATSTHDTKRGEDARARLNVLTELPDLWRQAVEQWAAVNESYKRRIAGAHAPSKNDEYLLYQTMIGSFPFRDDEEAEFFERLKGTAVKAAREAKVHTNWTDPDAAYEEALRGFIDDITKAGSAFLSDFRKFAKQMAFFGMFNSLSQTLIKITSPGAADFYQGSELWDLSMVDPDNRRPVDYAARQRMLLDIRAGAGMDTTALLKELVQTMEDGRVKMYLIWKALRLRAGFRELFERGDYVPLEVRGDLRGHLIAFARVYGERAAVTVAPRFVSKLIEPGQLPLGDVWEDTEVVLPIQGFTAWYDCFTEARLDVETTVHAADLLAAFPAACIVSVPEYHLKALF